MQSILGRIVGTIIATFVIAMLFGFVLTTADFTKPDYKPETSGHRAADKVYGLFGTVSSEIKRNDHSEPTWAETIFQKIAMPYALTSDLSAIFAGKLELGAASIFHDFARRT